MNAHGQQTTTHTERQVKHGRLRAILEAADADAVVLESAGAVSWYLDGARVTVSSAGDPVAAVVVTRDQEFVIVPRNEADRLTDEELPADVELQTVDWWESPVSAARAQAGGRMLVEADIPVELRRARAALLPDEQARYRALCADVASTLTDAVVGAAPSDSERQLAARAVAGIVAHGAEPLVVLVAGSERLRHRHPLPTDRPLGRRAMIVVCARRHGMIANATRWVSFGQPTTQERDDSERLLQVEADVLDASRPGRVVADVFDELRSAYGRWGLHPEEWRRHHQGGPCGYVGRDPRATPETPDVLSLDQAIAWNPSAPGVKIEDTALITAAGIETLTVDPRWPVVSVRGRNRPDEWIVA